MKVAVTGVSGFVGSHIARRLLDEGNEVISLGRTPPGDLPIEHRTYDLTSMAPPPLDDDVDAVVHMAAVIDVDDPPTPSQLVANTGTSWVLARWSRERGIRHVHASTGGVYGCGTDPFQESDPMAPVDSYSTTKAMAELAVSTANPEAAIIRYFFPYGSGTPNPLPAMLKGLLDGHPIGVREDGGPRFNPIHIRDAVDMTLGIMSAPVSGPVNVAGPEVTSFADIAEIGARLASATVDWIAVERTELHPYYRSDFVADIALALQVSAPASFIQLEEGIEELVNDVRSGNER